MGQDWKGKEWTGEERNGMVLILSGFEDTGGCFWCGRPPGRGAHYCSGECKKNYYQNYNWRMASSARLINDDFTCQKCGFKGKGGVSPGGNYVFWHEGVQVHHRKPINGDYREWNVRNIQRNLITLCEKCHEKIHPGVWYKKEKQRKRFRWVHHRV